MVCRGRRSSRRQVVLAERGIAVGRVMRDAVREVKTEWAELLGRDRFARLRELLLEPQSADLTRPA